MMISQFFATLLCLLLPPSINKIKIIIMSLILTIIGIFLDGPSYILNLPEKPGIVLAGLITAGLGVAAFAVFICPLII